MHVLYCFDWTEHSPCARCYSTGAHCCKNENTIPHHLGSATKTWLKSRSSSCMISGMLTVPTNKHLSKKERQSFSCLEDLACSLLAAYFIIFLEHGVTHFAACHPRSRRSQPRCVDQLLEAQLSCSNRPTWETKSHAECPTWTSTIWQHETHFYSMSRVEKIQPNVSKHHISPHHWWLNCWSMLNTSKYYAWCAWQQCHSNSSWPFHHEGLLSHHLPAKQSCTAISRSQRSSLTKLRTCNDKGTKCACFKHLSIIYL